MKKIKDIYSCKKATQLMSKSFEKKLSIKELVSLKAHLAICKTCVYCFRQLKALRRVYQNYIKALSHEHLYSNIHLSSETKQHIVSLLSERKGGV